LNFWNKRNLI